MPRKAWVLLLGAALLAASCGTAVSHESECAVEPTVTCEEAPKTATCEVLGCDVVMWWWVSKPTKSITMKVVTLGEWGWIGLGLSESGGMKGADIAVVTIGNNDTVASVEDTFSLKHDVPERDLKQSYSLLETVVGNNRTSIKLRRKLDTCDDQDLEIMQGSSRWVIWARGHDWPSIHDPSDMGAARVNLYPHSKVQQAAIEALIKTIPPNHPEALNDTTAGEVVTWDMRYPLDTQVPVEKDKYMCKAYHLPPQVMHATAFHPILPADEASERAIHHMVVYGCNGAPTKVTEDMGVVPCGVVPEFKCSRFIAVWTPGSGDSHLPEEAGLLVGNTTGGLEWVILQVHYSNLDLTPGLNGSAGIQVDATSKLRPYEVGTLVLGNVDLSIPPGQPNFAVSPAFCPSACTNRFKTKLRIIASQVHQHRAGQEISTRLIRKGQELQPLVVKRAFDFNHQTFTDPPGSIDANFILPGDQLLTQCSYNTVGRTNYTYWGEDTSSEMCFNFIMYYPRDPHVEGCLTYGPMDEGLRPYLPQFGLDPKGQYDMYMCSSFDVTGNNDFNATVMAQLFASGDLGLTPSKPTFTPYTDPQCKKKAGGSGRRLL